MYIHFDRTRQLDFLPDWMG